MLNVVQSKTQIYYFQLHLGGGGEGVMQNKSNQNRIDEQKNNEPMGRIIL
jgi:hypothetical protein